MKPTISGKKKPLHHKLNTNTLAIKEVAKQEIKWKIDNMEIENEKKLTVQPSSTFRNNRREKDKTSEPENIPNTRFNSMENDSEQLMHLMRAQ